LWAKECKRVLADNGTLFWYGDRKKIAYSQIIIDKYFNLEENIVYEKIDCQTKKVRSEDARSFINITERILMYSNEIEMTGLEKIYSDANCFTNIKKYMNKEREQTNLNERQLFKIIYGYNTKRSKLHLWNKGTQWQFPTEKNYKQLQKTGFFKKPYKELRNEYEELRRPFNIQNKYKTNVLRVIQEVHKTHKYEHDTVKPELLTEVLITATTRKNDLILVPFAGSGTECAMAKKHKRNFVGYEIKKEYVEMAINRCKNQNITLF